MELISSTVWKVGPRATSDYSALQR
jgi:hypothetical protein